MNNDRKEREELDNFLELVGRPIIGLYEMLVRPVGSIAKMALILELTAATVIGYITYTAQISKIVAFLLAGLLLAFHYIWYHFAEFVKEREKRRTLEKKIATLREQIARRPDHQESVIIQAKAILWDQALPDFSIEIELAQSWNYNELAQV